MLLISVIVLGSHQRPASSLNLVVTSLETIIHCLHWLRLMGLSWECHGRVREPGGGIGAWARRATIINIVYCFYLIQRKEQWGSWSKNIRECITMYIFFYYEKKRWDEKRSIQYKEGWLHPPGFIVSETVFKIVTGRMMLIGHLGVIPLSHWTDRITPILPMTASAGVKYKFL